MPDWTPRVVPARTAIDGVHCRLEPLDPRHAEGLHSAYCEAPDARDWTYLPEEREPDPGVFRALVTVRSASSDPMHMAVICDGRPLGTAALMRIDQVNGVLEIGYVHFAPRLQRTPAATEAIYRLLSRAFDDFGYRRVEWKCDSFNAPSRQAALRLGFRAEGVFRQAIVTKGRRRDTAWYAATDADWPAMRAAFTAWLDPTNFDARGRQRTRLAAFRDGGA